MKLNGQEPEKKKNPMSNIHLNFRLDGVGVYVPGAKSFVSGSKSRILSVHVGEVMVTSGKHLESNLLGDTSGSELQRKELLN